MFKRKSRSRNIELAILISTKLKPITPEDHRLFIRKTNVVQFTGWIGSMYVLNLASSVLLLVTVMTICVQLSA